MSDKEIIEFGGFVIEGETKEEMLDSLKSIHWSLECELDQQKRKLEDKINSLNL